MPFRSLFLSAPQQDKEPVDWSNFLKEYLFAESENSGKGLQDLVRTQSNDLHHESRYEHRAKLIVHRGSHKSIPNQWYETSDGHDEVKHEYLQSTTDGLDSTVEFDKEGKRFVLLVWPNYIDPKDSDFMKFMKKVNDYGAKQQILIQINPEVPVQDAQSNQGGYLAMIRNDRNDLKKQTGRIYGLTRIGYYGKDSSHRQFDDLFTDDLTDSASGKILVLSDFTRESFLDDHENLPLPVATHQVFKMDQELGNRSLIWRASNHFVDQCLSVYINWIPYAYAEKKLNNVIAYNPLVFRKKDNSKLKLFGSHEKNIRINNCPKNLLGPEDNLWNLWLNRSNLLNENPKGQSLIHAMVMFSREPSHDTFEQFMKSCQDFEKVCINQAMKSFDSIYEDFTESVSTFSTSPVTDSVEFLNRVESFPEITEENHQDKRDARDKNVQGVKSLSYLMNIINEIHLEVEQWDNRYAYLYQKLKHSKEIWLTCNALFKSLTSSPDIEPEYLVNCLFRSGP